MFSFLNSFFQHCFHLFVPPSNCDDLFAYQIKNKKFIFLYKLQRQHHCQQGAVKRDAEHCIKRRCSRPTREVQLFAALVELVSVEA
eukprot:12710_3